MIYQNIHFKVFNKVFTIIFIHFTVQTSQGNLFEFRLDLFHSDFIDKNENDGKDEQQSREAHPELDEFLTQDECDR